MTASPVKQRIRPADVAEDAGPVAEPPRVRKPTAGICPLGPVDISPLEAVLECLTESVWRHEDDNKPNKFDCFHSTRHVIFRFYNFRDVRDFWSNPGWTLWRSSLLPVMEQAIAAYGFAEPVFPKAMFASLSAGERIDKHTDGPASAMYRAHKIHVPIRTEPAALLIVDGVEYHLRRGHAYEVNNILPHGAFNGGSQERVHLIFEVFDGKPGGGG